MAIFNFLSPGCRELLAGGATAHVLQGYSIPDELTTKPALHPVTIGAGNDPPSETPNMRTTNITTIDLARHLHIGPALKLLAEESEPKHLLVLECAASHLGCSKYWSQVGNGAAASASGRF